MASIKVATTALLEALEARLAKSDKDTAEEEARREAHKKAEMDWAKKVFAVMSKKPDAGAEVNVWYGQVRITYNIDGEFQKTLPPAPKLDLSGLNSLSKHDREELDSLIKLIRLTSEPTISASTYKNVARFL